MTQGKPCFCFAVLNNWCCIVQRAGSFTDDVGGLAKRAASATVGQSTSVIGGTAALLSRAGKQASAGARTVASSLRQVPQHATELHTRNVKPEDACRQSRALVLLDRVGVQNRAYRNQSKGMEKLTTSDRLRCLFGTCSPREAVGASHQRRRRSVQQPLQTALGRQGRAPRAPASPGAPGTSA